MGESPPSKNAFRLYLLAVVTLALASTLGSYLLFRIAVPDVIAAFVESPAETAVNNPLGVALFLGVHVLLVMLVATIVAFGARVDRSTPDGPRR